ncbi:hypothetical protein MYX64_07295 [Nitrospinae bacterium AH_259_B05_G02_I21]|nr:hypothetical protein [Nitrospinae bacterium AH_259_B05_G02_I21]MDA2931841.1 hypothetical protein [Nitrospinae bacterium AH-259-F20]
MGFDLIQHLNHSLTEICSKYDFRLVGPGAERHGSLQWSFHKEFAGLNRFIFVALTSLPMGPAGLQYSVEVWVTADDNNRFVRHPINEFSAGLGQFESHEVDDSLGNLIARAVVVVTEFKPTDLVDSYIPSPLAR